MLPLSVQQEPSSAVTDWSRNASHSHLVSENPEDCSRSSTERLPIPQRPARSVLSRTIWWLKPRQRPAELETTENVIIIPHTLCFLPFSDFCGGTFTWEAQIAFRSPTVKAQESVTKPSENMMTHRCGLHSKGTKDLEESLADLQLEDEDEKETQKSETFETIHVLDSGLLLSKGMYDHLYEYQKQGLAFLYSLHQSEKKGGILADDMGLGKTVQIVTFLSGMLEMDLIKSVLLVMPCSLLGNWITEFKTWTPGIRFKVFHHRRVPRSDFTYQYSQLHSYQCCHPIRLVIPICNEGGDYNPGTGVFTCRLPGLYYFTFQTQVYNMDLYIKMVHNGHTYLEWNDSFIYGEDNVAFSTLILLKRGDTLHLEMYPHKNGMFGKAIFSGFLLY
ncbi:UNVERIFIED_CONTAM: hypothetical protein FKN15_038449 [Acipenser sinensis]